MQTSSPDSAYEEPTSLNVEAELRAEAERLSDRIKDTLQQQGNVAAVLETSQSCVCIKAADGQVLFCNERFNRIVSGGFSPVGRYGRSFLSESMVPISLETDALIVRGCDNVIVDYPGTDHDGIPVQCYTIKRSLLGLGSPKFAILTVTRYYANCSRQSSQRRLNLAMHYQIFERMDERDRFLAILIAQGVRTREMASRFEVSSKTIDNRRAAILKALELRNTMDLTRLLCRLQDNGFCDLGL